jgi:hypothetical protein
MRAYALAAAIGLLVVTPRLAHAFGYCSEPQEPTCVQIWSDSGFDLCKSQVQQYLGELDDWVQCISHEADDRAKKIVDRFNCHAKGSSFCM